MNKTIEQTNSKLRKLIEETKVLDENKAIKEYYISAMQSIIDFSENLINDYQEDAVLDFDPMNNFDNKEPLDVKVNYEYTVEEDNDESDDLTDSDFDIEIDDSNIGNNKYAYEDDPLDNDDDDIDEIVIDLTEDKIPDITEEVSNTSSTDWMSLI